jgi:hypothetical protein
LAIMLSVLLLAIMLSVLLLLDTNPTKNRVWT